MKRGAKLFYVGLILVMLGYFFGPLLFVNSLEKKIRPLTDQGKDSFFSYSDISVNTFLSFPNYRIELENLSAMSTFLGVVDTIFKANESHFIFSPLSIFSESPLASIKKIKIYDGQVSLKKLKNGESNWANLEKKFSSSPSPDSSNSKLDKLSGIFIENMNLSWLDEQGGTKFASEKASFDIYGDFDSGMQELELEFVSPSVSLSKNNLKFISNRPMELQSGFSSKGNRYELTDSKCLVNQLELILEGYIDYSQAIPDYSIEFKSGNPDFICLASLVDIFDKASEIDLETDGRYELSGKIEGELIDNAPFSVETDLKIHNGYLHFSELPQAISNINVDLNIRSYPNDDGDFSLDLKQFYLDVGNEVINGEFFVTTLDPGRYKANGKFQGQLDMSKFQEHLKLPNYELHGSTRFFCSTNGIYSKESGQFPKTDIDFIMNNGRIRKLASKNEISKANIEINLRNETGKMEDIKVDVPVFYLETNGNSADVKIKMSNPPLWDYDLQGKGEIDFDALQDFFQTKLLDLGGNLVYDLEIKSQPNPNPFYQAKLKSSSGKVEFRNFSLSLPEESKSIVFHSGSASFLNQDFLSDSVDLSICGDRLTGIASFQNSLDYIFSDSIPLMGNVQLFGPKINLNRWVGEISQVDKRAVFLTPPQLPQNLELGINASIGKVLFSENHIQNFEGEILLLKDAVKFKKAQMEISDNIISFNGMYFLKNGNPNVLFEGESNSINIASLVRDLPIVAKLLPFSPSLTGYYSQNLKMEAPLKRDFSFYHDSLKLTSNIWVKELEVHPNSFFEFMSLKTGLKLQKDHLLKGVPVFLEIKDGVSVLSPVNFLSGYSRVAVGGEFFADGKLNLEVKARIPSSENNDVVAQNFSELVGNTFYPGTYLNATLGVKGSFSEPKLKDDLSAQATAVPKPPTPVNPKADSTLGGESDPQGPPTDSLNTKRKRKNYNPRPVPSIPINPPTKPEKPEGGDPGEIGDDTKGDEVESKRKKKRRKKNKGN